MPPIPSSPSPARPSEPSAPTATRRLADVWCEGLSPERCGAFPEECYAATYCDGQRFCTSRRRARGRTCGEEGYYGGEVACCEGLVARCAKKTGDTTCNDERDPEQQPMCLACGDGVCSTLEQRCNCPEDCAVGEKRRKIRYRGSNPEGPRQGDPNVPQGATRPDQCLEFLGDADRVHNCLRAWTWAVLGRNSWDELQDADSISPLTPFDLKLMRCLSLAQGGRRPRSGPNRESCLQALSQSTKDARLDKLLRR
ncbi:hypothetical protein [Corallococcus llansteffanensis]|uniref:hypothetical protein n=1 Tax=Corallococcus llansteffanensis TaxID=2316731 RepID=UPI0011C49798|nr:hypothetical protein [Corallococcus llansteffanensis]